MAPERTREARNTLRPEGKEATVLQGAFSDFTIDQVVHVLGLSRQCLRLKLLEGGACLAELVVKGGQILIALRSGQVQDPEAVMGLFMARAGADVGARFVVTHVGAWGTLPAPLGTLNSVYIQAKTGEATPSEPEAADTEERFPAPGVRVNADTVDFEPDQVRSRTRSTAASTLPDDEGPPEALNDIVAALEARHAQTEDTLRRILEVLTSQSEALSAAQDDLATLREAQRRTVMDLPKQAREAPHRDGVLSSKLMWAVLVLQFVGVALVVWLISTS